MSRVVGVSRLGPHEVLSALERRVPATENHNRRPSQFYPSVGRQKVPREGMRVRIPLKHMILQSLPDVRLLRGVPPQPTHNIAPTLEGHVL